MAGRGPAKQPQVCQVKTQHGAMAGAGRVPPIVAVTAFAAVAAAAAALERNRLQWMSSKRKGGEAEEEEGIVGSLNRLRALLGPWVLENATLLAIASFITYSEMFPPRTRRHPLRTLALHALQSFCMTESTWFAQHFFTDAVYREMPYFGPSTRRPHPSLAEFLRCWARLMIPIRLLNGMLGIRQVHSLSHDKYQRFLVTQGLPSQGLFRFLVQFAIARCFFDMGFWLSHRAIHSPSLYSWIHKRHHEHHEPSVVTNNHFTVLDLFLEATVPFLFAFTALGALRGKGFRLSNLEQNYIVYAFLWYLNGSHAGKPVPCVSFFPPLSFLPWIDRAFGGGVAHHHAHHRLVSCNYGIAAWPDKVFGTFRPLKDAKDPELAESAA